MNDRAILALIGDLYSQISTLQIENEQLRNQLDQDNIGHVNMDEP